MSRSAGWVMGLDSCGRATTLALGRLEGSGVTILRTVALPPRTANAGLPSAVEAVLGGVAPSQLAGIAVVTGPGSFTGMRTGLSAVKALSYAVGVPVLGLSRLAVLEASAQGRHVSAAVLYAGRGQVYLRTGALQAGELGIEARERRVSKEAAAALIGRPGVKPMLLCEERLAEWFPGAVQVDEPTAADALQLAARRMHAEDWDDAATLDALYLWREDEMFQQPAAAAEQPSRHEPQP